MNRRARELPGNVGALRRASQRHFLSPSRNSIPPPPPPPPSSFLRTPSGRGPCGRPVGADSHLLMRLFCGQARHEAPVRLVSADFRRQTICSRAHWTSLGSVVICYFLCGNCTENSQAGAASDNHGVAVHWREKHPPRARAPHRAESRLRARHAPPPPPPWSCSREKKSNCWPKESWSERPVAES